MECICLHHSLCCVKIIFYSIIKNILVLCVRFLVNDVCLFNSYKFTTYYCEITFRLDNMFIGR